MRRAERKGIRCGSRQRRNVRSEEHTSELQSLRHLVCRLLLEKKNGTVGPAAIALLWTEATLGMLPRGSGRDSAQRRCGPPQLAHASRLMARGKDTRRDSGSVAPILAADRPWQPPGLRACKLIVLASAACVPVAAVVPGAGPLQVTARFCVGVLQVCAYIFFFFNATATPEIYTLSLHDALPI